jgi:hypothetical protein
MGEACVNFGLSCGCLPLPCGNATAPQCTGACPASETCRNFGTFCACVPPGPLPCGDASAPQCDGACPQDFMCAPPIRLFLGSPPPPASCGCFAVPTPCGDVLGSPLCFGVCPSATPICADLNGTCECTQ